MLFVLFFLILMLRHPSSLTIAEIRLRMICLGELMQLLMRRLGELEFPRMHCLGELQSPRIAHLGELLAVLRQNVLLTIRFLQARLAHFRADLSLRNVLVKLLSNM
jgi:hypothetical protein